MSKAASEKSKGTTRSVCDTWFSGGELSTISGSSFAADDADSSQVVPTAFQEVTQREIGLGRDFGLM